MPKQIQTGKVSEALQRAFGFKGKYSVMLDEVVVPVYQIADPVPADPQRICFGHVKVPSLPSTVTDSPAWAMHNPGGSGILVVISGVSVNAINEAAAPAAPSIPVQFRIIPDGEMTNDGNKFFRDQRLVGDQQGPQGAPKPIATLTFLTLGLGFWAPEQSFAVVPVRVDETLIEMVSASGIAPRQPLLILTEGRTLQCQLGKAFDPTDTNNVGLVGNLSWFEVGAQQTGPVGGLP